MKSTLKTLVAALAFGSTLGFASSASAGVIDLFSAINADQAVMSNANGLTVANQLIVGGSDVVGNARDLIITRNAGANSTREANLAVNGGSLVWSNDTGVTSTARVQWDGHSVINEATPSALNYTGLGGVSLYAGCGMGACTTLSAIINQADLGFTYQIGIYTDAFNYTLLDSGTLFGISSPYNSTYALSWFGLGTGAHFEDGLPFNITQVGAGANLSNVGALEFVMMSGANVSIDLELDSLQTVPEPTSLLLFGLGLAGLAALRRRQED